MEITDADYTKIPVSEFGAKMLRNMGWDESKVIGRNKTNKIVKPVEYISRPERLGLGAVAATGERTQWLDKDGNIKHCRAINEYSIKSIQPTKSSFVEILYGKYKGFVGVVISSEKEFVISLANINLRISLSKDYWNKGWLSHLTSTEYDHKRASSNEQTNDKTCWLYSNLKVRVISKSLENGKYFNSKCIIEDVLPNNIAVLNIQNTLVHAKQEMLETLVIVGSLVRILNGIHKHSIGTVVSKTKSTCLVSLNDDFVEFDLDSVCATTRDL